MRHRQQGLGLRGIGIATSLLASGEFINKATRFAATIFLARALSLADFGVLNVSISIAGLLVMLSNLGLPEVGTRQIAIRDDPESRVRIIGLVLWGRLLACSGLGLALILLTLLSFPDSLTLSIFALAMAISLSLSGDWYLRGTEQMGRVAWSTSVGGLTVLIGSGFTYLLSGSIVVALTVFVFGDLVSTLVSWLVSGANRPIRPSSSLLSNTVKESWPIGLAGLIIYASYANLDVILIAALLNDSAAGLYSAPFRVFVAVCAPVILFSYSIFPQLSRELSNHVRTGLTYSNRLFRRTLGPLCGYGLLVLGLAVLFGEQGLIFVFGADFAGGETSLVILCSALPFFCLGYPVGYSLIAQSRNQAFLVGGATSGTLNLILLLFLIQPFGIAGAAVATGIGLIAGGIVWLTVASLLREAASLLALAFLALLLAIASQAVLSLTPVISAVILLLGVSLIGRSLLYEGS